MHLLFTIYKIRRAGIAEIDYGFVFLSHLLIKSVIFPSIFEMNRSLFLLLLLKIIIDIKYIRHYFPKMERIREKEDGVA